nr:bromodomain containing 2 [Hymenolepis microstoma]
MNPVTDVADYDVVIKKKMDFCTIRKNIKAKAYGSRRECIADIFLVFVNCYIFYPPDAEIVGMAQKLEQRCRERLQLMYEVEARFDKPNTRSKSENIEQVTPNTDTKRLSQEGDILDESQAARKSKMGFAESDLMTVQEELDVLKYVHLQLWKLVNNMLDQFNALTTAVNGLVELIDNKNEMPIEVESEAIGGVYEKEAPPVNEQTPSRSSECPFRVLSNLNESEQCENAKMASSVETQQTAIEFNDNVEDLLQDPRISPSASGIENIKPLSPSRK